MFITCGACFGQNLVPNGGFEQFSNCPNGYSQLDFAVPWTNPHNISYGSPDYYHQCASASSTVNVPNTGIGFQAAHSGGGFSGIYAISSVVREYMEVQLSSTLVGSNCYHFEMYVNLANVCKYTTDDIAVYFSDTTVTNVTTWLMPFTPQVNNATGNTFDSLGWTLVSGNFVASGGEKYLIIGNFKDDANTTTTLIYPGATANYIYYFIDDVCVTPCGTPCGTVGIQEQNENAEINIYPNPLTDRINFTLKTGETVELYFFDGTSRLILSKSFNNSISISTEQWAKGIYFYELRSKNGVMKKGKVVKS